MFLKKVPAVQSAKPVLQPSTTSASSEAAAAPVADISSTSSIEDNLDWIKLIKHLNVYCLSNSLFKTFSIDFQWFSQKKYLRF